MFIAGVSYAGQCIGFPRAVGSTMPTPLSAAIREVTQSCDFACSLVGREKLALLMTAEIEISLAFEAAVDEYDVSDGEGHAKGPPREAHHERVLAGDRARQRDVPF